MAPTTEPEPPPIISDPADSTALSALVWVPLASIALVCLFFILLRRAHAIAPRINVALRSWGPGGEGRIRLQEGETAAEEGEGNFEDGHVYDDHDDLADQADLATTGDQPPTLLSPPPQGRKPHRNSLARLLWGRAQLEPGSTSSLSPQSPHSLRTDSVSATESLHDERKTSASSSKRPELFSSSSFVSANSALSSDPFSPSRMKLPAGDEDAVELPLEFEFDSMPTARPSLSSHPPASTQAKLPQHTTFSDTSANKTRNTGPELDAEDGDWTARAARAGAASSTTIGASTEKDRNLLRGFQRL